MKLLLIGDIMLGRLVNETLRRQPPGYPWGDTIEVFRSADLRIGNLECVFSSREALRSAPSKLFHFLSDAKNVAVLRAASIDAVSLANNHTLDFGHEALLDTLSLLSVEGIAHAGAGRSFAEASAPAMLTVGRDSSGTTSVGLLAFSDNEPRWEARSDRPGVFYVPTDPGDERAGRLLQAVREARRRVDVLLVSAHWGPNWGYRPSPRHPPFARALIDAGADIVYGHSCHVFQGIEIYRGKPILYSTGDFVDDYAVDPKEGNDRSFIFVVDVAGHAVRGLRLYPTTIAHMQARRARGSEAEAIAVTMIELSAELGTKAQWEPEVETLHVPVV